MNRRHSFQNRCYFNLQIALVVIVMAGFFSGCAQKSSNIERKQLFNYDWKFFLGDIATAKMNDFDDRAWRTLNLPHDWSIEGKIHPKNPTGVAGGYFPAGIGWYRKSFKVPEEWTDKLVSIYFEGVYMNSEVFINGKSLGVYPYGYSSFIYDLTPYLEYGHENVIAVRVDNSQHVNSRWYSGSGIYRHVWLIVTNPVHVAHWGVGITTPEVSSKKATVQVKTLVKNETSVPQSVVVKTQLLNSNNRGVGENHTNIELAANSEKEIAQTINVTNPLLWSPETPNLYQAQIEVIKDKQVFDNTVTTFGIRSIDFSTEKGFLLNGKPVILNGGCVHHDNGCLGAAAFDRAEERKVELLKAAGFNAVRPSHNPPSEAFLDACDRLGLLVIDESYPRDAFENWELVNDHQYIIGDFVWTAMDYLGESSIGRWYYSGEVPGQHWENDFFPWHGAYCGDIDLIGWRKPISHYRSMLYNDNQKLYMAVREPEPYPLEIKETLWSVWPTWESWTWAGFEGREILVEVYSKYPKVKLYFNNTLVGEQATTREQKFKATFSVPYTPGLLKAVGVEGGKEIESTVLQTAGDAAKIKLTTDRIEIAANGQDLSFVTVEITDKDGIIEPNASNRLQFRVEGEGTIVGVDNADIKDTDPYVANTRKAWKGRALVVIRSNLNAGDIELTVSSPGLSDATISIKTK